MITPVILSGGAGTRLWPLSRELYPKQLLPLVGDRTMLQETVNRLKGLANLTAPIVVCNDEHRFLVAEQLRQIDHDAGAVILEPVGRNTAPAVALAALQATLDGRDPMLLVLPADHVIHDIHAFHRAINLALPAATDGALLTFGIVPDRPETGYGYIKRKVEDEETRERQSLDEDFAENTIFQVAEFVEKPDLATAQEYVSSGKYYWNSGMFLFKASVYLDELERHAPRMLSKCKTAWEARRSDLDFTRIGAEAFDECPSDSIDYAVMEKTDKAVMVPLDAGWNDVGSWSALWDVSAQDADGNVCKGDVISIGNQGSYLNAGTRLVAGVGLEDMVVVETADAVLVAAKDSVQDVKQVVAQLKAQQRGEHLLHRRVNRPWGAYEGLDQGNGFLVKRITVNPGASLSLQRHQHRAEHWVVVRGVAKITCGEDVLFCEANQSVYIPIGAKHRLENSGEELLEIIEVQTGSLLSEDDIERFDDQYGR